MGLKLKVFQGTPDHSGPGLCFGCRYAQVIQGQQISDLTVWCEAHFERPKRIPRPVVSCTDFKRRDEQTRGEMEKIAWILESKRGKVIGFFQPAEHKYREKTEELDDPED
jgi:hypothetical protein